MFEVFEDEISAFFGDALGGRDCTDLPEAAYQDRYLCNRYVNCTGEEPIVRFCSKGLLFNPATQKCEQGVPCKGREEG